MWFQCIVYCSLCGEETVIRKVCVSPDYRLLTATFCPICNRSSETVASIDALLKLALVLNEPATIQ